MKRIRILSWFLLLLIASLPTLSSADPNLNPDAIVAPDKQNLFNNFMRASDSKINLWVTDLGEDNEHYGLPAAATTSNNTNSNSNEIFNNLLNSNIINQVGVGVKINF